MEILVFLMYNQIMFLSIVLPVIICFIPLIAAFFIFLFGFKIKAGYLVLAILMGLIAVLPISIIQFYLPSLNILMEMPVLRAFLISLLLYGLVEECLKCVFILPLPKKNLSAFEFLLLAFTMGLALGCFESVVYYLDHLQMANNRNATLLYGSIFLRIFSSDLIHLTCTGLCGLFVYSVRNKMTKASCLIFAIILHGIYDFFAGFQNGLRWFAAIAILLAIVETRQKYLAFTEEKISEN